MGYKTDSGNWTDGLISDPADEWAVITPSDAADIPVQPKAIYVGGTGTIMCRDGNGNDVAFTNVQGILPIRPRRILATGTSATGIVGIY